MYASAFVLGFHGCDEAVGEAVLAGRQHLSPSTNDHDWLGHGIYLWENSPERARHWADFLARHPRRSSRAISKPFVLGAILDLGLCLDLTEAASLEAVRVAHQELAEIFAAINLPLPRNEPGHSSDENLIKRNLDCAVINYLHESRAEQGEPAYDSVRGAFFEGRPLYAGAGIMEKTHIQICVRHHRQIRGYFRPIPRA
jgi:hypothetical protein